MSRRGVVENGGLLLMFACRCVTPFTRSIDVHEPKGGISMNYTIPFIHGYLVTVAHSSIEHVRLVQCAELLYLECAFS